MALNPSKTEDGRKSILITIETDKATSNFLNRYRRKSSLTVQDGDKKTGASSESLVKSWKSAVKGVLTQKQVKRF